MGGYPELDLTEESTGQSTSASKTSPNFMEDAQNPAGPPVNGISIIDDALHERVSAVPDSANDFPRTPLNIQGHETAELLLNGPRVDVGSEMADTLASRELALRSAPMDTVRPENAGPTDRSPNPPDEILTPNSGISYEPVVGPKPKDTVPRELVGQVYRIQNTSNESTTISNEAPQTDEATAISPNLTDKRMENAPTKYEPFIKAEGLKTEEELAQVMIRQEIAKIPRYAHFAPCSCID